MKTRANKPVRVLTMDEASNMSADQLRWYRAMGYLMPIAGGAPEGDGDGGGSAGEGGSEGEGAPAGGTGGDDDHDDDDDDEDDDADDDHEGDPKKDEVAVKASELERLKRISREHDRAQKQREKEEAKLKERQRREQGQYEELLREKDEAIAAVEAERDEARYQLDAFKRRVRVTDAAKRLGFKDADDAFRFLSDEDSEDETSTERALKRLARAKPYLVSERRSTGAPVNGDGATLTLDQIKNMSPDEVNSRWDEVQKAMASA